MLLNNVVEATRNEKIDTFLEELSKCGCIRHAADAVGISENTIYRKRQTDPEFALRFQEAYQIGANAIEREAFKRAFGYKKELVFQGQKTGETVEEYDSKILLKLLDRHPAYAKNPVNIEKPKGLETSLEKLSIEELEQLRKLQEKMAAPNMKDIDATIVSEQ